jgi:1-acyl-sn-glycerol-3-phosphate acyltransferase
VFNHYSRAGVPAWWTAIALGGALVQVGLTEPEPRWVMTHTLNYLGWLAPLSQWALRRIAWTYNAFPMPPMPPAPQDRQACAATVRHVIAFARQQPAARVCLAPEGRDSGDGSLIAPPTGAGRFVLQLCRTGMKVLPVGVCQDGGAWHVRFGSTFTLSAPGDLSADERDGWAAHRVMGAIADLLPRRLRGASQVFP